MPLLPIRLAAKQVHKNREYVRKLIDRGEVTAIRNGGDPESPRLLVDPVDIENAIRRLEIYVPEAEKHGHLRTKKIAPGRLHPAAAAM